MHALNTMFNQNANTTFINDLFSCGKIAPMDETMNRLYEAARLLRGLTTPTEVARALNQSQQVINNWERRGMSKGGMLLAQETIGCSASWLKTGDGPMTLAAAHVEHVKPKAGTATESAENLLILSARHNALIKLFDGLTASQQDEVIRELEETKRQNDALIDELLHRRQGNK